MQSITPEVPDTFLLEAYKGTPPPAPAWFEEALRHAPERTFFHSLGARIELLTWGNSDKPGLLFLHGNSAHADWWAHIAPFFASEWRCAALSWSGMGASDRRPEGYTVDDFVEEARGAAEAGRLLEGPTRPLVIGHSLGGLIGMGLVARYDLFRGLVIIDTPINLEPARLKEARSRAPKPRAKHRPFNSLEEGLARFRLSPPQQARNEFIADYIARRSLVECEDGWFWRFDPRRVRIDAERCVGQPGELRCPTALIYGDRSALVTPETLPRSLDILPAGTPTIAIPDAAHHILIDQPLALVGTLRALLTRWPEELNRSLV